MQVYEPAKFETKFNQVTHEIELYLDSSNGDSDSDEFKYPINPNAVVNMVIEDTLADWVTKGHITFMYTPEEGSDTNPDTGNYHFATPGIGQKAKSFYNFRNDGNDKLRVRIIPKLTESNTDIGLQGNVSIKDKNHWSLSYLFSIYDVEDIDTPPGAQNAASATIKCLKVYFWDCWYQKMITNVMQYSTALSYKADIEGDKVEGRYYNPGVIPTGQAIREIIDLSLSTDSEQSNYSGTTVIDPSLMFNYSPTLDGKEWEDGAAKIFYTTPTGTTAYESLTYIFDKHISENSIPEGSSETGSYDFSLLMKEKGPEDTDIGYLTLRSLGSFFEKAGSSQDAPGPFQQEHFYVQGYSGSKKATKQMRGPTSNGSDTVDFKSLKYGTIASYRFVDISALTNSKEFSNSPVYSFDFNKRQFNIEFESNSVETARKLIGEKYIKNLYTGYSGSPEKLFLVTLDTDKKKNKNITPVYSPYGDDPIIRQHAGLQKLLYVGVFQNTCINFRTLGLSFREPGRFISIDRTEGVDGGNFDDKFYGQWFVINVKHIFETEFYYNDITAIKLHRFTPLATNFPGSF